MSRRFTLFLALVLSAFALAACGQLSHTAEEHLARGVVFEEQGDLVAASIEYKNALQQDPVSAEGRFRLGTLFLKMGDPVAAELELGRARDRGWDQDELQIPLLRASLFQLQYDRVLQETRLPGSFSKAQLPEAMSLRGFALFETNRIRDAEAAFSEALALDPTHLDARYGMAWVAIADSELDRAHDWLKDELAASPPAARAWELLGDIHRFEGRIPEARDAYDVAIEHSHNPVAALSKRAQLLMDQGDYAEARKDIDRLGRIARNDPRSTYLLGIYHLRQGAYRDAQVALEQTLAQFSDHMPAVLFLGITHFAQGHWRQAEAQLARFVSRFPEASDAETLLALARLREGDTARAERSLRAVLARNPDDAASLRLVAGMQLASGDGREALYHLQRVVALEPDSASARVQLGLALMQEGRREEAFTEFDAAIGLEPMEMYSLEVALINDHLQKRDYEAALNASIRLRDRAPGNPLAHNLVGMSHLGQGNLEAAAGAFRGSLDQSPGFWPARQNLALLALRAGKPDEASALIEAGLEHDPEALGLLMVLADVRLQSGDFEGAGEVLARAVQAHPSELAPRISLARFLQASGKPAEAIGVLREVEATHGRSSAWLRQMVSAQFAAGEFAGVIPTLAALARLEPENVDVWLVKARVHAALGELTASQAALEAALTAVPEHLTAGLTLAGQYMEAAQLDRASEILGSLERAHPGNPQVLGESGILALREGRLQEAVDNLTKANALLSAERRYALALGESKWQLGDRSGAMNTFRAWLEERPQDHQARLSLARSYLMMGEDASAAAELRKVVVNQPDNVEVLNNLAWLLRNEAPDDALALAQRAVALAPDAAPVLDTLGVLQLAAGDHAAALENLARAAELAPEVPQIRLHFAKALMAAERKPEAVSQLQRLISQHPETDEAREAAALLSGS